MLIIYQQTSVRIANRAKPDQTDPLGSYFVWPDTSSPIIYTGGMVYPLYTGGFFHCHMLYESICHLRGVGSILLHAFIPFLMENPISKQCTP